MRQSILESNVMMYGAFCPQVLHRLTARHSPTHKHSQKAILTLFVRSLLLPLLPPPRVVQVWQAAMQPHLKQLQLVQLMRVGQGLLGYGHHPSKPWAGLWFIALQVRGGALVCMCACAWGKRQRNSSSSSSSRRVTTALSSSPPHPAGFDVNAYH